MNPSYRLAALKALTDHLKGITPVNDYPFDLSTSVFRGRVLFGDNDPIPLLSILESPRSDQGLFAGESERKDDLSLMVQGWVDNDPDNPTDPAYELMEAVEHRLERLTAVNQRTGNPEYPAEYCLNRTVADVTVRPGVVRPPMEGVSSKAFFYLPVTLTLVKPDR